MSRLFKIKGENGEILDIGIQQYEVGLYVCVSKNGRMVEQFGTTVSEKQFMKEIADIIIPEKEVSDVENGTPT